MAGLAEGLVLIESLMVIVRRILVDRLRSFLVLPLEGKAHVSTCDRVSPRVELLDPLRKVSVLRITGQNSGLIQLFPTIDPVHLDADLYPSLLHISVSSDTDRVSGSYLATWTSIIWILLVYADRLVDVCLHELVVLRIRCLNHTLIVTLSGVSDAFDGLALGGRL